MVVLFGILALVAQFLYWAEIVKGLNDQLVEGRGHRDIDQKEICFFREDSGRDEFLDHTGYLSGRSDFKLGAIIAPQAGFQSRRKVPGWALAFSSLDREKFRRRVRGLRRNTRGA